MIFSLYHVMNHNHLWKSATEYKTCQICDEIRFEK